MTTAVCKRERGWLRGAPFDSALVLGTAALALLAGLAAGLEPEIFLTLVALDIWLLGYPHVVATFTRLSFDAESFRTHRFLVLGLPPILIVFTLMLTWAIGAWVLLSIYLYWQWFHYTRQSYGLEQIYRRKATGGVAERDPLAKWAFYAVPVWGILHRSHQDPGTFFSLPLKVLPVPGLVVDGVAAVTTVLLVAWILRTLRRIRRGESSTAHTLYMVSHFAIFIVGYLLIPNIAQGWLVVNIWHNAQYLLIVWMYNNRRFGDRVDPEHRFLSVLSRSRNVALFFVAVLVISTVFYLGVRQLKNLDVLLVFPVFFLATQTINFHHYLVDGLIWKVRRRSLRANLGIAG